jgi:hypothetical protein
LIRPKAQDTKIMAFEPYRAAQIMRDLFRFAMLAAINLDH